MAERCPRLAVLVALTDVSQLLHGRAPEASLIWGSLGDKNVKIGVAEGGAGTFGAPVMLG
jgi:hypothetical protein